MFTLDLSRDWVLESVLAFKKFLGNTDEELSFLRSLAQGLVMANIDDGSGKYITRYVAITESRALARQGFHSDVISPMLDGRLVLAEVVVPARIG